MGRPLPASGTSTRHWRQAPTGSSSGWSQNRGIWTPTCSAARMIRVPAGTLTWTPSIVSVTRLVFSTSAVLIWGSLRRCCAGDTEPRAVSSSGSLGGEDRGGDRVERAAALAQVLEVLVAEVLDRARDRAGGAVAERAERPAQNVVTLVQQELEVLLSADALLQVRESLDQPPGALPARGALAAGLVLVELRPSQHRPDDAGRLVEDLQRAGAEHGPGGADGLEVERHVEVLGGQDRRGRATRRPELQLVAVPDPAGELDQRAQRDAQWRLE